MAGVLIGFAIIAAVIGLGFVLGRFRALPENAAEVLSRLAVLALTPPLMFTVVAQADLNHLFSTLLPISALAATIPMALFFVIARVIRRRPVPESVIGSMSSGYVNAGNMGIPVAVYVLGDAAATAPIILLQVLLLGPFYLSLLDLTVAGRLSLKRIALQPLKNPLLIGSALGLLVALTGFEVPQPVMDALVLIGGATVPVVLISFGISLATGSKILAPGPQRTDALIASAFKMLLMPAIAWALGHFVWGME